MMKISFLMVFYYLLATLLGTLVASCIFMVCCDLTLLVVGEGLKFFSGDFFIRGIFFTFPIVASVIIGFIIFYGIRHREHPFIRLITYILMSSFTWLLFFPGMLLLEKKYNDKFPPETETKLVSSGYFRKDAGGVFYFSRVEEGGIADGVFFDLSGITGEKGRVIRFNQSRIEEGFTGKFSDTIIRDSLNLPLVIVLPLEIYVKIVERGHEAWNKGYISWLVYCFFALALLSTIAMDNVSCWRLINGISVMFAAGIVSIINHGYATGWIFKKAGENWSNYFGNLALNHTGFLNSLFSAPDILLAVINFVIFIILLVTGIILFVFSGKTAEEEE